MQNVVLSIHDDDDPDDVIQDSKPRSAFFKLKEVLGTKLAQKRRDEIMKRKADAEVATKKSKRALWRCWSGNNVLIRVFFR